MIYDVDDYRAYVRARLDEPGQPRGAASRLARAAGCHLSYLSQVVRGSAQLTPDQALGMCRHWALDDDATECFLALVGRERAGTPALREHHTRRIAALRARHRTVSGRVTTPRVDVGSPDAVAYYADWLPGALHMCLAVPALRSLAALAARLGVATEQVEAALGVLERMGLVERATGESGGWRLTRTSIHLPQRSPLAGVSHRVWRSVASDRARLPPEGNIHYTALHSLSQSDVARLREILLEAVDRTRAVVEPSPEEDVVCVMIDYFRL